MSSRGFKAKRRQTSTHSDELKHSPDLCGGIFLIPFISGEAHAYFIGAHLIAHLCCSSLYQIIVCFNRFSFFFGVGANGTTLSSGRFDIDTEIQPRPFPDR